MELARRASWLSSLSLLVLITHVSGQQKHVDAPAPAATARVRQLLDEATQVSGAGGDTVALKLADGAVAAAQQAADTVGEAAAERKRASLLNKLDRRGDALAAWRSAAAASKRVADGPGEVEAVGWLALLDGAAQQPTLLRQALTVAQSETARPIAALSVLLDLGIELIDRSRHDDGRQVFEAALAIGGKFAPDSMDVASALGGLARIALGRGDLNGAQGFSERALALGQKLDPNSLAEATILNRLGEIAYRRGDLNGAGNYFRRAFELREKLAPDSIDMAASLTAIGLLTEAQGDLRAARGFHERSLAIKERLRPDSPTVATTLQNLGILLRRQGDFSKSEEYFNRALRIREKLSPDSLDVAAILTGLGNLANDRGQLSIARDYHQRALAIHERLAPNSLATSVSLNNLGSVAWDDGDLSAARDYFERALAIREKLSLRPPALATALDNLGLVARIQGDVQAATQYTRRSLALREQVASVSLEVATSLFHLAVLLSDNGDQDEARKLHERALSLRQQLAPDSLGVAESLTSLGILARARNDLTAARDLHQRALAVFERLAPDSLAVSSSLANLANVDLEEGNRSRARAYAQRAVAIREKLAPASLDLASVLRVFGRLASREGDLAGALEATRRAWAIVRAQATSVVGDEAQQAFHARWTSIGTELIQLQCARRAYDEAFGTLEEGRAQALLQMMAERGIVRRLAPADVWQRYQGAQAQSNRDGKALEAAGAAESRARQALEAEIVQQSAAFVVDEKRQLLAEREKATEQAGRIATQSRLEAEKRWREVRQTIEAAVPVPIGVSDARGALPVGTVLLAFSVGDDRSTVFVVERDGPVQAFPIDVSLKELTARVDFVRRSVSREAGVRALKLDASDDERVEAARALFRALLPATARRAVATADRLLISPDGVLWDLPFAVLVTNDQGRPEYLGLEKPIVYAQSLRTFAQGFQASSAARPVRPRVLVVGNPVYDQAVRRLQSRPASAAGSPMRGELALLTQDSDLPESLPYAEEEAKSVAALYRAKAATGIEPSEAWFRRGAADADVIHLATHGYFNPFRAVSSGLLLAAPDPDSPPGDTSRDGALQAWEVFVLQLRADLVVLSACQTGLGARVPGEGLIGLTRAFQVAGAASIIATQWRVADRRTATAMVRLHQHLLKGMSKDEALRQAMRALASDPATAHPYYWAPFVLVGDYRPLRWLR